MNVTCKVEDCFKHHDMENEVINAKARQLAKRIEDELDGRQIFCDCNVDYTVSIKAEREQKVDCKIEIGCPHFYEQLVKAIHPLKKYPL